MLRGDVRPARSPRFHIKSTARLQGAEHPSARRETVSPNHRDPETMRATRAFLKTIDEWPLSGPAASFLAQSDFGHVIEGEVVPSASGETMAVYDPATRP